MAPQGPRSPQYPRSPLARDGQTAPATQQWPVLTEAQILEDLAAVAASVRSQKHDAVEEFKERTGSAGARGREGQAGRLSRRVAPVLLIEDALGHAQPPARPLGTSVDKDDQLDDVDAENYELEDLEQAAKRQAVRICHAEVSDAIEQLHQLMFHEEARWMLLAQNLLEYEDSVDGPASTSSKAQLLSQIERSYVDDRHRLPLLHDVEPPAFYNPVSTTEDDGSHEVDEDGDNDLATGAIPTAAASRKAVSAWWRQNCSDKTFLFRLGGENGQHPTNENGSAPTAGAGRREQRAVPPPNDKQNQKDLQRDTLRVNGRTFASQAYGKVLAFVLSQISDPVRDEAALTLLRRTDAVGDHDEDDLVHNFPSSSGTASGTSSAAERDSSSLVLSVHRDGGRARTSAHDNDGYQRLLQSELPAVVRAKKLLSSLNRTYSGGMAFEKIIGTLGSDNIPGVFIVPESRNASPLELVCGEKVAMGRAHTQYRIISETDQTDIGLVDAFFVFVEEVGGDLHGGRSSHGTTGDRDDRDSPPTSSSGIVEQTLYLHCSIPDNVHLGAL